MIPPTDLIVTKTPDLSNPAIKRMRVSSTYSTTLAVAFLPSMPMQFTSTATVPAPY